MGQKKKDKLQLNLEKHKHRVAMVTDEGAFNQHEPNSNMARMFVVMLLIHVVVIGGIIIYDFVNGEEAVQTELKQDFTEAGKNVLPDTGVNLATLEKEIPIEECSTYEWRSQDSLPLVAQKLGVSEDILIKMNGLDKGRQLQQNDIIRFPKRPVVKAVAIGMAGANGEIARPVPPEASLTAAEVPMNLAMPGEKQAFSFSSTIEDELVPAPQIQAGRPIQDSPPPAVSKEASGMPAIVELPKEKPQPEPVAKVQETPPAPPAPAPQPEMKPEEKVVPKAIPYTPKPEAEKAPVKKKVIETPPPAKKEPVKTTATTHVVKPNETLYRIAAKYGISVKALQDANRITKPESLRDGMKLTIPKK